MTGFIQIVEVKTSKPDEMRALAEEMRARGGGTVLRSTITEDRDRPDTYLQIVEFDSYETAMENSSRPEVREFSARFAALCDEPPLYTNLTVAETWSPPSSPATKAALAGTAAAVAGVAAAGVSKARTRLTEQRERLNQRRKPVVMSSTSTTSSMATPPMPTQPGHTTGELDDVPPAQSMSTSSSQAQATPPG